jgi:DNA-binding GntR family transcriptional regulator
MADRDGPHRDSALTPVFHPADVRSLRDLAYEDIRQAILTGALQPGQRVKERDVAAQMGISTTPVKEALRRLEQEGLVVSQPRRGAVVSGLVTIPVEEIEEIRGALEAIAARLAASRLSETELARLEALVADMAALTRDMREPQRRVQEVSAFHRLILEGSRNDFLVRFVETLAPFERVHQSEYLDAAEAQAIQRDHEAILAALTRHDGEAAGREMLAHYDRGRAYWRKVDEAEGRRPPHVPARPARPGRRGDGPRPGSG